MSNRIADRFQAKYQQELDAKLERVKATLDNSGHVTKAQFDNEFEIYRKLTKAFYHSLVKLESFAENAKDDSEILFREKCYVSLVDSGKSLTHAYCDAQDTLFENAAFINKEIYLQYDEILTIMEKEFRTYIRRIKEIGEKELHMRDLATKDNIECCDRLEERLKTANESVRAYLQSLRIVD